MESSQRFFDWAFKARAKHVIDMYNGVMESKEKLFLNFCSHEPADKTYGKRGMELLIKYMYGEDACDRVDLTKLGSLEMAKRHSWINYQVNKEAALLFHQPPGISYKLKGKIEIYDEETSGKRELYQQFINAQHDVYHIPDMNKWLRYPAYLFRIEEIYDNSASKNGFGKQLQYPIPEGDESGNE